MSKIINATEAYALSKNNRKEADISRPMTQIEAAIKKGDFKCSYDGYLDDKQLEKLRALGYVVTYGNSGYNETLYTISWEPLSSSMWDR